jgi:hypothetical protein
MSRQITIPSQTLTEEIQSIAEYPNEKFVTVVIGNVDDNGEFIVPQQLKTYEIRQDMYDELNSANPSWNSAKPEGTYFNEDLWHFIDILRQS